MSGQYGIKETKECLDAGFAVLRAVKSSMEDGSISYLDIGNLIIVFPAIGPALENIAAVPKELSELSSEEAGELLAHAATQLGLAISEPKLVSKINASLKLVLALGEAYSAFKA